MKTIAEAAEGFLYLVSSYQNHFSPSFVVSIDFVIGQLQHSLILCFAICILKQVSSVGVTGARASVNPRVESLLHEIKKVRR